MFSSRSIKICLSAILCSVETRSFIRRRFLTIGFAYGTRDIMLIIKNVNTIAPLLSSHFVKLSLQFQLFFLLNTKTSCDKQDGLAVNFG